MFQFHINKTIFILKAFLFIVLFELVSCQEKPNVYELPAMVTKNSINAVIEIPAGTNTKYEYDIISKKFVIDTENGKKRIIDFLSYPGNYGFVPSTLSKANIGGDGDALDVLVISESIPTGTVIEVIPIAMLKLIDDGEIDYKVIAVPKDKSKQTIKALSYKKLTTNYPSLLKIIELWFLNYNKNDISKIDGWANEKETLKEINDHIKRANP